MLVMFGDNDATLLLATKVSPGCKNCYAEGVADLFWASQYRPMLRDGSRTIDSVSVSHHEQMLADGEARPRRFTDVLTHADRLYQPLHWKKPARIFVNSMSDLFHEDVERDFIARVFAVMAFARQHTFQILTKRADRMREVMSDMAFRDEVDVWITMMLEDDERPPALRWDPLARRKDDANALAPDVLDGDGWPLPNVWLGVSVENQKYADERIPLLLQTPAAVRFLSCEPLLGPLNLDAHLWDGCHKAGVHPIDECAFDMPGLDWVIVGGESGPKARPCEPVWARSLVRQCHAAGVPVFVKQLGGHVITRNDDGFEGYTPKGWPMDTTYEENLTGCRDGYQGAPVRVRLVSKKGGDPNEWPEDLRVRQFPNQEATYGR